MPLPTPEQLTGPNVTEAQFKNGLEQFIDSVVEKSQQQKNVFERTSYVASGFVTKQRVTTNNVVEITFTDITIFKGSGNGLARVKAGTYSVAVGQALYIDLDAQQVDSRYIPTLTISGNDGYVSLSEGKDAFFTDRKIILFVNDRYGFGGVLANRSYHASRPVGDVWLKQSGCRVYYDASTRTLSWSAQLTLPAFGRARRYRIEAGSITLQSGGLQTVWIDLSLADASGNLPQESVKTSIFGTVTGDDFEGLDHQLPIYIYNSNIDGEHYPVGGFPKPTVLNLPRAYNDLADDDIIVNVGTQSISVYMKGSKRLSNKYIDWRIARQTDEGTNVDVWRIQGVYEAEKPQSSYAFERTRESVAIVTTGEIECALCEDGSGGFFGGYHGDEKLKLYRFLVDGKPINVDVTGTYVCKKFELVQTSDIFRRNTTNKAADHSKHLTFENRKLRLKQNIVWSVSMVLKAAMMTMLPVKRKRRDTSGEQVTHTAMREPNYIFEDVSEAGFEQVATVGSLPHCKMWGSTGLNVSVEFLKHPNLPSATFYISNPTNYNKFYYSVAGNYIGTERHTTSVGESWDTESIIEVNTDL